MANHYVKASFMLTVTDAEAAVLARIDEAIEIVSDPDIEDDERTAAFGTLGEAFAATFPPTEADIFGGFLAIFSDPAFPGLGLSLHIDPSDDSGKRQASLYGDQVDIEATAALIQAVAKSALPFGFEYCLDCDRLRPGQFGGGYVVIREAALEFGGSARSLQRALERGHREGVDGYVLTIRDPEEGMLFWNNDSGFGELATATVFSEAEANGYDIVIADDQPEWLDLPPPLA